LAKRYIAGDSAAGQQIITANLRHVVPIALRYRRYGMPVGELIAEGNLALLRALAGFEPERGLRFATYANYWIRADILALILRQRSMVGGGRGHLRPKYFFRLRREHARLATQLGDVVKVQEELATRWQLAPHELSEILDRLERPDASVEAPITQGARVSVGDCLASSDRSQEELLARDRTQTDLRSAVKVAAADLDPRERFILEHRLMADPESEYSLVRIGEMFGVSRERARQLESRVKDKLREKLADLLGPSEVMAHLSAA
ncbi:MAG TPA: sigma-70 family RNA polymerase sigma factor, partial [Polyangiales bacterium]|nr:sigma-70 family RNA polymerase sigma factor [Polyangiales bacterium]